MSSHGARGQCQSPLKNKRLDLIPVGRQLQRTPPTKSSNTQITHPAEDPAIKDEEDSQNEPQGCSVSPSVKEERRSYLRSSLTPASAKMGIAHPDAFIQGMQGYQWTDADLEFVYQAKQQKLAQQLQQELSEVEKTLQAETQRLELAVASRDHLRSELSKTPSCDSLLQLCKSILSHSRPSDQLDGLGDKALLSLLNLQEVQRAVREENGEISRLEREAAKAQELRDKQEKAVKEMDNCRKKISTHQANVDALKVELTELKTQLSEKEASVVSQVTEKGHKGSRRAKLSTKALKEKVLQQTVEKTKVKAGGGKAGEGREKGPKKRTAKKELAPDETSSQVKFPEEMYPEELPPKVKASKVAQVLEKGRKGSRTAKTSTTTSKDKALKKTALKNLSENKMVLMETADQEMVENGKPAPEKATSKKTAKRQLAADDVASQEKTPEETTPEEIAPKELSPKVKASNEAQVLEKGRKGSRTAKTSTTTSKDKALKNTALKKLTENKMVLMETADQEMVKNGKPAPKIQAPKKVTSKKTAKKQLATDNVASQEKTPEETTPEELAPKVKGSIVAQVLEKGRKGSRTAKTSTTTSKDKALKMTALRETIEMESAQIEANDKVKTTRKVKAPKKTTSKNTAEKEMPPEGIVSQIKTLHDNVLEEMASKVRGKKKETILKKGLKEASNKETAVKNKVKKETDPEETASEMMALMEVAEKTTSTKTARKKATSKVTAPKEMPEKETALKGTAPRRKASKQKSGENPSENEDSLNAAPAPGRTQKAAKPPKSPLERDPETTRRSKRNTVKSSSLSKTIPEKTTRSRKR